ncbi:hypothetical protein [Mumia zhuanghuii]|uniref:Uncharacterized protein n=1 Tax=Mumia zhuanghuii TaxID=2585211 RepID=A0A5C4MAB4_9ACTN|nr:hypothetical protein [Mumia zhuanghuii]TNC28420.1 hypothetical protein FHE65_33915 [Mumia zhuanghuii]
MPLRQARSRGPTAAAAVRLVLARVGTRVLSFFLLYRQHRYAVDELSPQVKPVVWAATLGFYFAK